jgi:trimeric autotransporter adhesin
MMAALCGVAMMLAVTPLAAEGLAPGSESYPSGTIITIAGGGTSGLAEGGPFSSTSALMVQGMYFDSAGNLYLVDFGNNMFRMVDASGTIRTIAGNGKMGFSGDGGPAASAQLNSPYSVAFDSKGRLYIADFDNCRIRKVDTNGVISTVVGTGIRGFSGDGGPAVKAQMDKPSGIAIDSKDNLYIADWGNCRIRKVDTAGTISTYAGTGKGSFTGDGGPAASATLLYPASIVFDVSGNLYIADVDNHRIRKVDTSGIINTVIGNGITGFSGDGGPALSARIFNPWTPVFDALGNMYFSDASNDVIRKVDTNGIISTVAGCGIGGYAGDGGPATLAKLAEPNCIAVDSEGNVYIATSGFYPRIRMVIH